MKVRLILMLSLILVLSKSALPLLGQQAEPRRKSGDRFSSRVEIQPMASKCSAEAAQPPALAVSSNDFVKLERTLLPAYAVKIYADGRIVWERKIGDRLESPVSKSIQPEDARALIERIRASGFWSLCEKYPAVSEHYSEAITTVRIGDQEKQVSDCGFGAPEFLRELDYEIDLMADTHRHFHGDPIMENFTHLDWDSWYAKAGVTKLMQASARGTPAEVMKQLSAKADPNAQDASGWTALMYASLAERPEIMQALLDAGADPNLRSHRGQTAIMAVTEVHASSEEKVRILKAAGGDINAQDADGQTALMRAADGLGGLSIPIRSSNSVSILLREGARKDLRDAKGHTVLERLESKARSVSAQLASLPHTGETFSRMEESLSMQLAEYEKLRQLLRD